MSSLDNLALPANVQDEDKDSLGGSYVLESGVYPMNIDVAYMGMSQGGATSLNLELSNDGQSVKQTIYVTSGKAKGQKTTYTDKNTGEERPLPGMSQANAICALTVGKLLSQLNTEQKVIKLYNYDAKAEIDTTVEMVMDLIGKPIVLGLKKVEVDKNVKNDADVYVPSGETRMENEIDKIFEAGTNLTMSEKKAGMPKGEFITKWADKFAGVTVDKSTGKKAGGSVAGTPGASAAGTAPPLFPAAN